MSDQDERVAAFLKEAERFAEEWASLISARFERFTAALAKPADGDETSDASR